MNNVRPHMLGINGVGFPPSSTAGGNLGNINGLGAMGGMGNMGGMGGLGNMGGMGAMAGGGGGGGGGQHQHQHQQHPGQHAPAMGLLQNHQPQQHANPPPMGGLQPGGNQPGQNQGASGVQPQLGQQPNGIQFMGVRDQMLRQTFERQRFQQQQAQAQQQQQQQQQQSQQQQQQQMPHQQGQQQQQLQPQPGAFLAGMSHMGNFGSPRSANLVHTGSTNGMSSMAGLGGMGGMGIGGGAGFQSIPPGAGAAMALRRVPSQTGQPNQSQPPVGGAGNAGMNMGMVGGMGVGGMNSVGLGMPASLNNLRQGGMPGVQQQRMSSYPGAQQQPPGSLAPGQQRSVSSMAHVPPEVAAVITQEQRHREQQQQQQQAQAHMQQQQQQQQHGLQHPRTPSVVNANPPMPPNAGINNANTNGGPIPNSMNPNAIGAPGMQRTPSAQSMGAPPGGMHPSHPNHPNHANPNLPHGQQQPNPPPFTNPLHHSMQNPQMQHQQHQHQQLGGQQQQHHLGQHAHQQPSGMSGVPMPGIPGTNHVPNANAMPGGMQGHPSQQRSNAGSPPRPGTSGHSQPQTPSIPVSAASMRPQSRAGEQQPMIGFPGGAGQPQFGGAMRQPGSHQHQHPHPHPHPPGQQGQLGNPYGAQGAGMGGRATPQHTQSPMAALGSSPGGPISGRPGSSGGPGPGGVGAGGMSTPNLGMVGLGGRAGPVPPGGPVPGAGGGFPTPAQQLAEQQAARTSTMGAYAGAMPPLTAQPHNMNTPGSGPLGAPQRPPTSQAHSHAHPPPPFASPVHHHQQRTGSPAVHRQPTPALQQAGPLARMGTPTLAQGLGQPPPGVHAHALQQNRSPSRVRTPSRQQNHAQAGPGAGQGQGQGQGQAQTPRTQAAQLPTTPGAGSSAAGATAGRAPPMGTMGRQGVGLGISPMHGGPPAVGQQQQPPNAGAQPQQQNATTAGQQRPITQDGSNPPPNMGMMSMTPYLAQRQSMFTPMQAIGRLMSFSDTLSQPKLPSSKEYWEGLVAEYFSSKAVVKITLWKDNAQQEAKPFDITVPILPRFFLVTSQSGVSSMTINFEGAKERPVPGNPYSAFVDCPNAAWTYYYHNGYIVTLRGSLTATLVWVPNTTQPPPIANGAQPPPVPLSLKIETMTFNSEKHEKAIRVEAIQGRRSDPVQRTPKMMMMMKAEGSPGAGSSSTIASAESTPALEDERNGGELVIHFDRATIPTEPVNAFGIPQATMRCLELAESVGHMSELIEFTLQTGFRPLDALKNYAHMLREQGYMLQPTNQNSPGQLMDAHLTNGVATSPAVTLYQTSPPVEHATTNSGGLQPPPNMSHRPGANTGQGPGDTSSPNMSSTPASAQTPNPPPLSAAPTSTSSTPMVPHATLKRKAGDTSSPTTATAEQQQPPAKRAQRKRSVRH